MFYRSIIIMLAILNVSISFCQRKILIDVKVIDQLIKEEMHLWRIPGCAVVIVNDREVLFSKGYGYRDVENRLPVNPGTVFKIASCTKSFTAAAAGLMVHTGLLEWDTPVKKYLPELEFQNRELTQSVTLRDLLTHRTGLYDDDWSWVGDHVNRKRLFEILSEMPLQREFRNSFSYSNMTYSLAGTLIETVSGKTWRQLIREQFLVPLSLEHTLFSHTESSGLTDFAFGYEFADTSGRFVRGNLNEHFTDSLSVCEPFAFISSSALDVSVWLQLFLQGGKWKGKEIIPPAIFRELTKPVNYIRASENIDISESYYCMGWIKNNYKGHPLLQHSGGLWGFKSFMSLMPNDSIGIVVLTNGQPYRFAQALSLDLYDLVLKKSKSSWLKKYRGEIKSNNVHPANTVSGISGTVPSKPLSEYAGTYISRWIGEMKVIYENGELFFKFHHYPKEKMKHAHYDTFFTEPVRSPGTGITFRLDHDGRVAGLWLNDFYLVRAVSDN